MAMLYCDSYFPVDKFTTIVARSCRFAIPLETTFLSFHILVFPETLTSFLERFLNKV